MLPGWSARLSGICASSVQRVWAAHPELVQNHGCAPPSDGPTLATALAADWLVASTTMSAICTWAGRVAAYTMLSAMSAATKGSTYAARAWR